MPGFPLIVQVTVILWLRRTAVFNFLKPASQSPLCALPRSEQKTKLASPGSAYFSLQPGENKEPETETGLKR